MLQKICFSLVQFLPTFLAFASGSHSFPLNIHLNQAFSLFSILMLRNNHMARAVNTMVVANKKD